MPTPEVQILVCVNERGPDAKKPSCAPLNGLELYRRFKDEIRQRGLRDRMIVTRTGCLKHCSHGVTVTVWPWNHWYRRVEVGDVGRILDAAERGDSAPIESLQMPADAAWE